MANFGQSVRRLRQMGRSVREIAQLLSCSKATASKHCRGVELDAAAAGRLQERRLESHAALRQRTVGKWAERRADICREAEVAWPTVRQDATLMGFLGLYWGEGTKKAGRAKNSKIAIANTDPAIVAFAMRMFRELSPKATKAALLVLYYPDQCPTALAEFWYVVTGVKPKMKPKYNHSKQRKCSHGVAYLSFCDWRLYHRIMTWLRLWKAEIPEWVLASQPNLVSSATSVRARPSDLVSEG